jgi:hypothetical protein
MSARAFVCGLIVAMGLPIVGARVPKEDRSQPRTMSVEARPALQPIRESFVVRRTSLDPMIAAPPESTLSRTQRLFSRAPVGDALARIAAYGQLEGMPGPDGASVDEAIALAERQPRATLDELRTALRGFPAELEENRRQLVHIAARLDAPVEMRAQLVLDELGRFGQASSPDVFGPAIMFDLLIELTDDVRGLEAPLLAVLRQQGAGPVAEALLSRVEAHDPDEARALEQRAGLGPRPWIEDGASDHQ